MGIALTVPQRTERVVASDLEIRILGPCRYPSPLARRVSLDTLSYVGHADHVLLDDRVSALEARRRLAEAPSFELSGPRNRVFFDVPGSRPGS